MTCLPYSALSEHVIGETGKQENRQAKIADPSIPIPTPTEQISGYLAACTTDSPNVTAPLDRFKARWPYSAPQ